MKKLLKIVIVSLIIFFGLALVILSTQIAGLRAFVVKSPSMEPTILTGSLIITKQIPPGSLQKGDIITFIQPAGKEFITHRIVTTKQHEGVTILKTKGDKNKAIDEWTLAGGGVVGKVVYTIPYLGYLFSLIQTKAGILFFILIPSVYIIVDEIHTMIRTIKKHRKKNTEASDV